MSYIQVQLIAESSRGTVIFSNECIRFDNQIVCSSDCLFNKQTGLITLMTPNVYRVNWSIQLASPVPQTNAVIGLRLSDIDEDPTLGDLIRIGPHEMTSIIVTEMPCNITIINAGQIPISYANLPVMGNLVITSL